MRTINVFIGSLDVNNNLRYTLLIGFNSLAGLNKLKVSCVFSSVVAYFDENMSDWTLPLNRQMLSWTMI